MCGEICLNCEMDRGSVGFRGSKTLSLTLDLLLKNIKDTNNTKYFTRISMAENYSHEQIKTIKILRVLSREISDVDPTVQIQMASTK